MGKRVADLLVETLQAAGVRTCYGIVGDTMNRIAHAIDRSRIDWVHMRHEEAGAFAAAAEASLTGRLTACAGSCGPGSLHFINGLYEANRNRAPVILIATQIVRQDLGFESIQEIDYGDVFKGCSVYCEMIVTPEQARRKTVAACQAALRNAVSPCSSCRRTSPMPPRMRNPHMRSMRGARSFAQATRTSMKSQPFSTRAMRSRSTRVPGVQVRMTRWWPPQRV
jgi:hypothetical protein